MNDLTPLRPPNEITDFVNDEHGFFIRVVMRDGDPWFVAIDVAVAIDVKNSRQMIATLDADYKGVYVTDTVGGKQALNIISEAGVYTVVMRSDAALKPGTAAYNFRRWIAGEVLPAIRKTGKYALPALAAPEAKQPTSSARPPKALSGAYLSSLNKLMTTALGHLPNLSEPAKQNIIGSFLAKADIALPDSLLPSRLYQAGDLAQEMQTTTHRLSSDPRYKALKADDSLGLHVLFVDPKGNQRSTWKWNENGRRAVLDAFAA